MSKVAKMRETREMEALSQDLEREEAGIERCMESFWEMGERYERIRSNRLYKATHNNFGDYCKERWGLHEHTVIHVIKGAQVRSSLQNQQDLVGLPLPENPEQARWLAPISDDNERASIWKEAVSESGGSPPTGSTVKRVVERRKTPPSPPPEPTPRDIAFEKSKAAWDAGEAFQRRVEAALPHIGDLSDDEAQSFAYKIVETVHGVLATLEEHDHLRPDVVRGIMGHNGSDGREIVVS